MDTWFPSLRMRAHYSGDVLIIDYDLDEATTLKLTREENVIVRKAINIHPCIATDRFRSFSSMLEEIGQNYDVIMLTDGNDVEFFRPLEPLFEMARETICCVLKPKKFSEYMDSLKCLDPYEQMPNMAEIESKIKNEKTINAGMIAGPSNLILQVTQYITQNLKHVNNFGADQVLLNIAVHYHKTPCHFVDMEWNFDWRLLRTHSRISILHKIGSGRVQ